MSQSNVVSDVYGDQIEVDGKWYHAERIFGRAASTFSVGQEVVALSKSAPQILNNKEPDEHVSIDLWRESGANITSPDKVLEYADSMRQYGGWGKFPPASGRVYTVEAHDVEHYLACQSNGHEGELAWSRPLSLNDIGLRYLRIEEGHHRAHAARLLFLDGYTFSMPAFDFERQEQSDPDRYSGMRSVG